MFSRSAIVLRAVAAVELTVFVLAVSVLAAVSVAVLSLTAPALAAGWLGVLLLLLVVAAFSAYGVSDLSQQSAGPVDRPLLGVLTPTTPFSDLDRMFRRPVLHVAVVDVDAVKRGPDGSSPKPTAPPELR